MQKVFFYSENGWALPPLVEPDTIYWNGILSILNFNYYVRDNTRPYILRACYNYDLAN